MPTQERPQALHPAWGSPIQAQPTHRWNSWAWVRRRLASTRNTRRDVPSLRGGVRTDASAVDVEHHRRRGRADVRHGVHSVCLCHHQAAMWMHTHVGRHYRRRYGRGASSLRRCATLKAQAMGSNGCCGCNVPPPSHTRSHSAVVFCLPKVGAACRRHSVSGVRRLRHSILRWGSNNLGGARWIQRKDPSGGHCILWVTFSRRCSPAQMIAGVETGA